MDDDITGAYIRVKRDNKWQNLDIACLTDDELDAWIGTKPIYRDDNGWGWTKFLASWIRDNVIMYGDKP